MSCTPYSLQGVRRMLNLSLAEGDLFQGLSKHLKHLENDLGFEASDTPEVRSTAGCGGVSRA